LLFVAVALVLPRLSVTLSVTVICSDAGFGVGIGEGSRLQFGLGLKIGVVLVSGFDVAIAYVHEYKLIVPGAVEADPSNRQSKVLPLLVSLHASVPDGPLTVNRATATDGGVTLIVAVPCVPLIDRCGSRAGRDAHRRRHGRDARVAARQCHAATGRR
jgi:hypothetical protein